MTKLSSFNRNGANYFVRYNETIRVKDGVLCDTYEFVDDDSQDLAIIYVDNGCSTPLQKVIGGTETVEGYISGRAVLRIGLDDNKIVSYDFPNDNSSNEVTVLVGQTMQWEAIEDLTIYEICTPPYKEGRFLNTTK